jgi:CheY-like chemotaxis protein
MATMVNVLFVDDDRVFLETFTELCTVLSHQTWGIECAVSVDCALAILRQKPIHLVVLDLGMPLISGSQLLGIIKQYYPAIKIAVLTGNATDGKRADILALGAELFIEKPVTPAGIRSVFNLLNDLVLSSPIEKSAAAAPDDLVVVATDDGKWNPAGGAKK